MAKLIRTTIISNEDVFDITVEGNHNFFANGILIHNCVEIGMWPQTEDGRSGVQYCNLTEINGKKCVDEQSFLDACKYSAVLGTLQAGYTDFAYLGPITEEIVRKEALLGCSITGMMDSPEILFDPKIQRKGAKIIKDVNASVAKMIGINPAARTTALKPAGTTSCVLGTASGIHPHHAKRYFRRVQANKLEFPAQKFQEVNPLAVEESVWSNNNTDLVITFMCEVPPGAITKNTMSAIDLLEKVKLTQQNWIEHGTREDACVRPFLRHNVSNTITVQPSEWQAVTEYLYNNREWFTGVSLLPSSGDKDYPQAPFCTVYTPAEIVKLHGDGSVMASGLIVDGLAAYDNNLWRACDIVLGITNSIHDPGPEPDYPKEPNEHGYREAWEWLQWRVMRDKWNWLRRANQFADRYFAGDKRAMTYCLKDVHNWKLWCDLQREYRDIDWSEVVEADPFYESVDKMGAQACNGGACEIQ